MRLPAVSSSRLHKIYRSGVKWSLAGSVLIALLQFLQTTLFARWVGPSATGEYALAAALMFFVSAPAEAGLQQALVQAPGIRRRRLWQLGFIQLMMGGALYALLWYTAPTLGRWFGSEHFTTLARWMGISLWFSPFISVPAAWMTRRMRFDLLTRIETMGWAISFLITLAGCWLGYGILSIAAAFLGKNMITAVASVALCPPLPSQETGDTTLPELLRFGFFDVMSRWTEYLANYLDKALVGKILGMEALGLYQMAFSFLMLPTARIGYVFTRVGFPVFSRLRNDRPALQSFFERSSSEIIVLLFPMYLGLALFSVEITQWLLGETWILLSPLLVAFGLAGWVRTVSAPFPQLLRGMGKPGLWWGWLLVFTLLINSALYWSLLIWPGPETAAWSRTAVKYFVEIALLGWLAKRLGLQLGPTLLFAWNYLKPWLFFGALGGAIAYWTPTMFAAFLVKIAFFCGGLWWYARSIVGGVFKIDFQRQGH